MSDMNKDLEQRQAEEELRRRNPQDRCEGAAYGSPNRPGKEESDDLYDDSLAASDEVNDAVGSTGVANNTGTIGNDAGQSAALGAEGGRRLDESNRGTDELGRSEAATTPANTAGSAAEATAGGDENRDPLSGAPGAHPVGAGLGAAGGGLAAGAATGAAVGTVAGPVGTAIGAAAGAIVGGVVGGYAGKGIAEAVNPTVEHAYWQENYASRPYVRPGESYDEYGEAYEYGWTERGRYQDRNWEEAESDLRREWERTHGSTWDKVKGAVRDSWERVTGRRGERRT